ncbi:Trichodiene oxygenase [Escovopsis weberi]|uniref:Trichodiene oxygenase n=1 Tax=Escovopsis weberi TaxID=150374 RepID=A0A0N0RTI6_ESCWE|nr:Trichodiene oxygenase [Escovopsis weberi]
MSLLLFELATNPEIHNNIRREVLDAAGDSKRLPDARVLERLPWLNGATPVGVSQPDILHNEEIFPEPLEFKPERWFDPSDLELKAFVPFMKGTRSCVGIDFAFDEMHMLTALLAARFDFELYKTTWDRDLKYVRDCFVGAVDSSSKGVRVKIVGDNKRILL